MFKFPFHTYCKHFSVPSHHDHLSTIFYKTFSSKKYFQPTVFGSFKTEKMRFVQFEWSGRKGVGVEIQEGGDIVDVTEADPTVPHTLRDFITGGQPNLLAAKK